MYSTGCRLCAEYRTDVHTWPITYRYLSNYLIDGAEESGRFDLLIWIFMHVGILETDMEASTYNIHEQRPAKPTTRAMTTQTRYAVHIQTTNRQRTQYRLQAGLTQPNKTDWNKPDGQNVSVSQTLIPGLNVGNMYVLQIFLFPLWFIAFDSSDRSSRLTWSPHSGIPRPNQPNWTRTIYTKPDQYDQTKPRHHDTFLSEMETRNGGGAMTTTSETGVRSFRSFLSLSCVRVWGVLSDSFRVVR